MPDSVYSEKLVKNLCQLCLTKISPDAGKARLCEKWVCVESAPEILESRNVENWKGLTTKHFNKVSKTRTKSGKISKYLDKNQITFDELAHETLKGVPVLRNGNHPNLKLIRIDL